MPHLLKIRIDTPDSEFDSMLDAGPLVGETTPWGTFGEAAGYRNRADIRYVRDGNLAVGDLVVVRERQTATEVYIVALLKVLGVETDPSGALTPIYEVVERFDGCQPLDMLRASSPALAALPHFEKNAKGMMQRAITELTTAELDVIVTTARDSVRRGLKPLTPTADPGEEVEFTLGGATISTIADDEGYLPIEVYERMRVLCTEGYFVPPIDAGQIPAAKRSGRTRLLDLLQVLFDAGETGRRALLDEWREACDDPDVELHLMLRNFRPTAGVAFRQFDMCAAAVESEDTVSVYPDLDDSRYELSEGAMAGFYRSSDVIPMEDDDFAIFGGQLLDALRTWA